jgi:hypothetical protein
LRKSLSARGGARREGDGTCIAARFRVGTPSTIPLGDVPMANTNRNQTQGGQQRDQKQGGGMDKQREQQGQQDKNNRTTTEQEQQDQN